MCFQQQNRTQKAVVGRWRKPAPIAHFLFVIFLCYCFAVRSTFSMAAIPRTKCKGIPPGRGPFVVGLADVMSDNTVNGTFTRLYYPTDQTSDALKKAEEPLWIPNRMYSDGYSNFAEFTSKFSKSVFFWMFGSYRIPAILHADVRRPSLNQTFPVIVMAHGLGAMRTAYSAIALDLASWGFVVAAVEHRDNSACATYYLKEVTLPNGETEYQEEYIDFLKVSDKTEEDFRIRNGQVNQRADECVKGLNLLEMMNNGQQVKNYLGDEFDLSQFKGLLDLEKASVIGHSFGGATTIQSLEKESRFKVGVAFDAWMYPLDKSILSTIKQPLLLINTEKFHWVENIARQSYLVNPTNQTDDRKMITLRGTVHQSQDDFTFLTGKLIGELAGLRGDANPIEAIDHNNDALIAFLSRHLGIEYDKDLDKIFIDGAVEGVIQGSNIKLDPEKAPKSSL